MEGIVVADGNAVANEAVWAHTETEAALMVGDITKQAPEHGEGKNPSRDQHHCSTGISLPLAKFHLDLGVGMSLLSS